MENSGGQSKRWETWIGRAIAYSRSGTAIVLVTVVLGNLIRLLSSMTLTRMLDASVFGVVGMLSTIAFVLAMVSDVGIYPFVVRHASGNDHRFLDEVWTIRLSRGAILTVLMATASVPLARFVGKDLLGPAIAVWSVTFLIDALTSMAFASAIRQGNLAKLNAMDLTTSATQVIISIALATVVKSYWAIIMAMLIASSLRAWLSYKWFPGSRRRLTWSRSRMNEMWGFSRYIAVSGFVGLLLGQSDKLIFAKMMNLREFGVYTLASSLAVLPLAVVGPYVHQVLYPAFVRGFETAPVVPRDIFYKPSFVGVMLYVFAVGIFIGSAGLIVTVLYDPRYLYVATYLKILAIGPWFAMQTWASDQFMVASGRVHTDMVGQCIRAGWLVLAGSLGWRLMGSMGLVVAVSTMEIPAYLYFLMQRFLHKAFSFGREFLIVTCGVFGWLLGDAIQHIATQLAFVH